MILPGLRGACIALVVIGNFGWVEHYCELATPVTVSLAFSQVLFSLLEEGCKKYPIQEKTC